MWLVNGCRLNEPVFTNFELVTCQVTASTPSKHISSTAKTSSTPSKYISSTADFFNTFKNRLQCSKDSNPIMPPQPDFNDLPICLEDAWRINRDVHYLGCHDFEASEKLRSWSVPSLMTLFLRTSQAQPSTNGESSHSTSNSDDDNSAINPPEISGDDHDPTISPPELSRNPRHSFAVIQPVHVNQESSYMELRQLLARHDRKGDMAEHIDPAIHYCEMHIRSRGLSNSDGKFLVSLSELREFLYPEENRPPSPTDNNMVIVRQDRIPGAIEVLDGRRPEILHLHSNDEAFRVTFTRITQNILRGLDWQNVVVAGGIVLNTLLHVDPDCDNEKRIQDPNIDLYIFGLSPADAEKKALEIEQVWKINLSRENTQTLITKNNKTITLIPSYPHRRLQIILKVLPNPTAILLNFDLDVCALAFDGSKVFMLPRCARAIETGYSVFTMDLIWGSHLSDRRSTQEARVLKYADRGFGIRFLPSYANLMKVARTPEELPWYGAGSLECDCLLYFLC